MDAQNLEILRKQVYDIYLVNNILIYLFIGD